MTRDSLYGRSLRKFVKIAKFLFFPPKKVTNNFLKFPIIMIFVFCKSKIA